VIVPGSKLEKYEVLEKVGEGGMATVYRGRHTTLNREVAIKVMHPHLAGSERNRTRFAREAKAIETLRHPNILRIFDYSGGAADHCFIITEFIEGPTLRELLDDVGAMMPEPAAIVTWELCKALEVAHSRGIVHRDVKPENVMLTGTGGIKLMDFGIARMLDDAQVTMTGALVGSPAYMSPEQATDGEVGQASDLFAVGTMLYRMVTGTLPFRGSNPSIVIKAIIDGIYEDPSNRAPSLSPALADIIRRCLNRDLEVRYADAGQLKADLGRCLQEVGIDPEAPGPWSVSSYLEDSEGYEEALRAHLLSTLVTRGRREAEAGRTAEALRTFNRVLALDEDNEEVVAIIGGMRTPIEAEGRSSGMIWAAVAALVATVAGGLAWQLNDGTAQVAALEAAVLLPTLPFPMPDAEPAPPEPATPVPADEEAGATAVAMDAAEQARRLGVDVEVPTPSAPTPEDPVAVGEPVVEEPEVCEGPGTVTIVSRKHWTRVAIDGVPYLEQGPVVQGRPATVELKAGPHTFSFDNKYRESLEETVQVCGNRDPLTIVVDQPWKPHTVRFVDFPEGATVIVDGTDHGPATKPVTLRYGAGAYIRVMHDGEELASKTLRVSEATGDAEPGGDTLIRPGS